MSWTQGLNPEQVQAVLHNTGPLLILAGAGSGKTTVLVSRTGRMIEERIAHPSEICVLTFTNKAARELKSRVAKKVGDQAKGLWAGTFHSFGLQLLKKNHKAAGLPAQFAVIDHSDSQTLLKEIAKDIRINTKDRFDMEKILNLVNELRARGKFPEQGFDEYHELAEILAPKYVRKMELLGVVDFEGLLIKPLELFKQHPEVLEKTQNQIQQMMVDEFQDTNDLQMQLIDKIVSRHKNISVVGDDDQSIYGWRGAQVANILDFPKKYTPCRVVKLERNYRSTPAIIELANDVIGKNKRRHGKVLKAETRNSKSHKPELFLFESEEQEAEFIGREVLSLTQAGTSPADIAVLYRSNTQSGMIESILRRQQIAYDVSGGTAFFDRKEVKDVLAYLRLSLHLNDVSLRRIINTPARGLGDTSIEKINEFAMKTQTSFSKAAVRWREAGLPEKAGASLEQLFLFLKALPERIIRDPANQLPQVFRELGYRDYLISLSKDAQGADKKWILVEVLANILGAFVRKGGPTVSTLKEFVEAMELRDDQSDEEEQAPKVQLMTLHACKGLEFPIVFLIGVEEDLLPHKNLGSDIDEERRLFYVGITRAEEKLILSRCKSRIRNGVRKPVTMSRFLLEADKNLLIDHKGEFRPVTADERENLVKNFLANLGKPNP